MTLIFLAYDSKNWTLFFHTTQRIEPFLVWTRLKVLNLDFLWTWLKDFVLEILLKELFFFLKYDSTNWTFCVECDTKNWTSFSNLTRRIELFSFYDSKTWAFFFEVWPSRIEPFEKYDSKNWTSSHFWIWLKELNLFTFLDMTQRIELFLWLQAFWRKNESKNWIFFSVGLKELNFNTTHRIEPFFLNMTQKNWAIYPFFLECMTQKNWTLFSWMWLKELKSFIFSNVTQRIEPVFTWLKELRPFFCMTQRIESVLECTTQRIEPFCSIRLNELNTFFWKKKRTHRIELFFFWTWLKELNLFFLKRCFFSASSCITSTSAELFTCVVSTLAQSCVQHFSCCWMNSVVSIQDEFSGGLLSQNVSICPEWCRPHPRGFASFCRAFMRLDQFPFVVMYLCLSQLILSRQALF